MVKLVLSTCDLFYLCLLFDFQEDYGNAMKQLDEAVAVQEKLFDVPHEKLKSLQEKNELCCRLNLPDCEAAVKELQVRIEECKEQMAETREFSNLRLERIMNFACNNNVNP